MFQNFSVASADEASALPRDGDRAIPIDQLDGYLRAILKVKLREFLHLSSWFRDIPTTVVDRPESLRPSDRPRFSGYNRACPHKEHRMIARRRYVRTVRF